MSLLGELKRRNVLRAAALYAAFAWLLVQVATQVFPFFDIANWVVRWIVIAAIIGFPFMLVFAWFYEITPEGLKLESEVHPSQSIRKLTGKRLDRAIIAVLALAVVALLADTLVVHGGAQGNVAAIPAKSIAVLPLVNESGNPADQYFSDGLSEELISDLTRIDALKVIGRNSSFRFRNSKDDAAAIAAKLGVATLLEGTVRRQGDRMHIVLDLVKAADGSSIWSQTYDRQVKDIFALQEQIAQAVATALQVKLLGSPAVDTDRPPSGNLVAYNAFLQGNFYKERLSEAGYQSAIRYYNQAIRIDPRYARAYAALSWTWSNYSAAFLEGAQAQHGYAQARAAVDAALTLAPQMAAAHRAHGQLLAWGDFDQAGALAEYRRALQLAPNDPAMKAGLSIQLAFMGQPEAAIAMMQRALATDPLHAHWYYYLATFLSPLGRLEAAQRAIDRAIELQPTAAVLHEELTIIEIQRGDAGAALHAAQQGPPGAWQDIAVALALQIGDDRAAADAALQTVLAKQAGVAAYQIAEIYALRKQPDKMFEWLDRAWANRDPGITGLLYDPFLLRFKNDPRFAAFCRKVGLPLPGEKLPSVSSINSAAGSVPTGKRQ